MKLDINFNEINELRDPYLAQKTLTALIGNLATEEEKSQAYRTALRYFQNGQLIIRPSFFIDYSRDLYLKKDYSELSSLANLSVSKTHVKEYFILLCFELGKISIGIQKSLEYLNQLKSRGLNKRAILFMNQIDVYIKTRIEFQFLKLTFLIKQGSEQELVFLLKQFRENYFNQSKGLLPFRINKQEFLNRITDQLDSFSYRGSELYLEKIRWKILKYIIGNEKEVSAPDMKEFFNFFILTSMLDDYIYLSSLFFKYDETIALLFKSFSKTLKGYSTKYIIKNHPELFYVFKDQAGESKICEDEKKVFTENQKSGTIYESPKRDPLNELVEALGKYNEQETNVQDVSSIKNKIFELIKKQESPFSKMKFNDLLLLIRDFGFIDLMEDVFWLGHSRNLVSEAEIYLTGKILFENNKLSKAFGVLTYATSDEGRSLFEKVCHLKKMSSNE